MFEAVDLIKENESPKIRGWLILLGIGLVFSPIRVIVTLVTIHLPIFSGGAWELLTTETSQYYISGFGAFLIFEITGNLLCLVLSLYLLRLFFTRQKSFPKWYIGVMLFYLVFITLDSLIGSIVMPNTPFADKDTMVSFLSCFIGLSIWGTYLIKSQRSKCTFVMQGGRVAPDIVQQGKDHEISSPASQNTMKWQGLLYLVLGLFLVKALWEIMN